MTIPEGREALELRSLVKASGELELSLASVDIPRPGAGEVLVRIEAAPINPSFPRARRPRRARRLRPEVLGAVALRTTGGKYLVTPQRD